MEYSGKIQLLMTMPHTMYSAVLNVITNVPSEMPRLLANSTDSTSMPSMAPPWRMVSPLPTPEITPPKMAHSSKSDPASGEIKDTSTGSTFMIR